MANPPATPTPNGGAPAGTQPRQAPPAAPKPGILPFAKPSAAAPPKSAPPPGLRPAAMRQASAVGVRSGATVHHPKYGRGVVLRREGDGEDAKLTISFPGHGLKKIVEKYAGIKVEE